MRSALITGAALVGVGAGTRLLARLQLAFWRSPSFWRAQARAFRMPRDAHDLYVAHGLSVRRETAAAMLAEVYAGGVPEELGRVRTPLLAIAGEKEPSSVRRSLTALSAVAPGARLRLAPRMHHVWSIEDVALFEGVARSWIDRGEVDPRLIALTKSR